MARYRTLCLNGPDDGLMLEVRTRPDDGEAMLRESPGSIWAALYIWESTRSLWVFAQWVDKRKFARAKK